jgi:predicted dehydrogenase
MPSRPVKIAVLGGGYGAKVALPVLSELEEFEPVAVWSRTPERAAQLAAKHDLELGTSDLDELLSHPGLEAVHVATPVALHAEHAIAAANRGLHVLLDKPMATDLGQAQAVALAIAEAGVVGAVNYGRRFQATRERLLQRVAGVAGTPRMVSVSLVFDDHATPDARPFTWVQDASLGGGRMQGYGVHDLDLVLAAFGAVKSVAAATTVVVGERRAADGTPHAVTAEDGYVILLRFAGGGLGQISLTATARHKRGDTIEVYGADGTVILDADRCLHSAPAGEPLQTEGPLKADSKAAYARIARSFHAAIRDGAAPVPSIAEGLRVQALFDAIRTADAERRWVEPEPV